MEITNVSVNKINKDDSRLLGYATVIIDDAIAIHNIKIVQGDNEIFISMPSRKVDEKKYVDIVHPITNEVRVKLQEAIINKYEGEK